MSPRRPRQSTVPSVKPARRRKEPRPPRFSRPALPRRVPFPKAVVPKVLPRPEVARIIDTSGTSLVDVIDNLLNKGVVVNADLILALADIDLIYVRLSALLCAADRVIPDGPAK
jgi:hypothetical protein